MTEGLRAACVMRASPKPDQAPNDFLQLLFVWFGMTIKKAPL